MVKLTLIGMFCLYSATAWAQTGSLEAPATADIGSDIQVNWTGPRYTYDSIYVADPAAPDSAAALATATSILSNKGAVQVRVPDTPGHYELRYYGSREKAVLGRRAIEIVDVPASLEAADSAGIGQQIAVSWTGPGTTYDRIELHTRGAADDAKAMVGHSITGRVTPINLVVPETPGDYEIRYVTVQSGRVLARRPVTVTETAATLDAPDQVELGEEIQIAWTGPGNSYDRIELHPVGAAEDAKPVRSASLLHKSPVSFKMPEQPGDYELRYALRQTDRVIATEPVTVGAVETSLDAPERATADTTLHVGWVGPGNNYDTIGLWEPDAADSAEAVAGSAILNERNPLPIELPDVEGEYELRYRTAQTKQVLARKAIVIEPAGRLAVMFDREGEEVTGGHADGTGAVELILDASGSMLQRDSNNKRRIEIAREVLDEFVRNYLQEDQPFAMRVFGHKEADKCRTDLEVPLGPIDPQAAAQIIAGVNAKNLAKTPIADSLAQVPSDLAGASGPKTVILITDGEETCDGDPSRVIEILRGQGLDVQISIVGFAIDDADLKATFESWAQLGGGSYFDADSAEELSRSLRTVISGPFKVFDAQDQVAGQGVIGGADIVLPAGTYRIETVGASPEVIENVEIKPGELTRVSF
ncbi:vWA domain-containing protein [Elongatibacter sediminis]|uniref:VWA domain-containing protein n=1 Tax=Elongatibacter sediminis TaxID=3119006 RepID=A0AAW9RML2_9GAMM